MSHVTQIFKCTQRILSAFVHVPDSKRQLMKRPAGSEVRPAPGFEREHGLGSCDPVIPPKDRSKVALTNWSVGLKKAGAQHIFLGSQNTFSREHLAATHHD